MAKMPEERMVVLAREHFGSFEPACIPARYYSESWEIRGGGVGLP